MTAIWRNDGTGWQLLASTGFPDEAALHALVEQAPQILPLAGKPQLTVLGREVTLGGGIADLIAVEPDGRPVVIEVKLARNAEARRAVVAQVLAYAAFLHGMDAAVLEREFHLRLRGYEGLTAAVAANDQDGSFDATDFLDGLNESLSQGRFRVVLVLDEAPVELVQLVGFLEAVTDKLLIDLITVSAYDVAGSQIMVPQRVDPERQPTERPVPTRAKSETGQYTQGHEEFRAAIEQARPEHRATLNRLCDWAASLERSGLAALVTYQGKRNIITLVPRLRDTGVGLVTIYQDNGAAYVQFWRSVFERQAPQGLLAVERVIAPRQVGQGNVVHEISDDLLQALTQAYEEAAGAGVRVGQVESTPSG